MKYCDSHQLISARFIILMISGVLLLALPVAAHTLTAPATIQADGDGHYESTATFLVGPGSVWLAAMNIYGTENSGANELMIDYFCTTEFTEGEQLEFPIVGQLVNLDQGAMVSVQVFDCDEIEYWVEVEVLNPTVSKKSRSWGKVKGHYQ